MDRLYFGSFELRPAQRLLLSQGEPLEIGARAFDLLCVLVRDTGRLVTKRELLDRVWPDQAVEEANLHVQIHALRRLLGREAVLTVPGRGYQFALPAGRGPAGHGVTAPAVGPNDAAPALPPLLGRQEELARIGRDLGRHRLVTITGAGGSGKTLLARHLVAGLSRAGDALLTWVDLGDLAAPESVVPAVAAALGVHGPPREAVSLAQALADATPLLALDNAEHLVQAVAELAVAIGREAPGVRLLVTSQTPLRCPGEAVHALPGLAVPTLPCTADEALRHAAVALFVAHARQADRRFRFDDAQVEDVVAICASLSGSALGVQLAAALLGQMALPAVRERLVRRHISDSAAAVDPAANVLRSTLTWSHDLLTPVAARVFRRMAVAQGPMTAELVQALALDGSAADAAGEVARALSDLVDRSLVQCDDPASPLPRYRLLDAPRALALEHLAAAGERHETLARLARALAPLGDAWQSIEWGTLTGARADVQLAARLPVAADLITAFDSALDETARAGVETVIRMADLMLAPALARPGPERLRWAEGLRKLSRSVDVACELRARALDSAAALTRHSDLDMRLADLKAAAAAWREAGEVMGEFRALSRAADAAALGRRADEAAALLARVRDLEDPAWSPSRRRWRWFAEGVVAVSAGDLPRAIDAWRRQLDMVSTSDGERAQALHSLANAEQIVGDVAAALPRLLEAVAIARRIRARPMLHGFLLPNLLAAHVELGDHAAARASAVEGWEHARRLDSEAWWADHLALLAARERRYHTAARLLGLADAGYERLKDGRQALEQRAATVAETACRAALGDAAFETLRAAGKASPDDPRLLAVALATEDSTATGVA